MQVIIRTRVKCNFGHVTSLIGRNVVTPYPEKFPGLLYIPTKYEKSAPYSIGAIAKTKCGSGGAGGLASPIYKQASLAGRLINSGIF